MSHLIFFVQNHVGACVSLWKLMKTFTHLSRWIAFAAIETLRFKFHMNKYLYLYNQSWETAAPLKHSFAEDFSLLKGIFLFHLLLSSKCLYDMVCWSFQHCKDFTFQYKVRGMCGQHNKHQEALMNLILRIECLHRICEN